MKFILTATATIFLMVSSYSQTQRQIDLVSDYFSRTGKNILQDLAHPFSTCTGVRVYSHSDHVYYITLSYRIGSQNFNCDYRLVLDGSGNFVRLRMGSCGYLSCFLTCRLSDPETITSASDKARYERYLGKSLSDMTCEEYTLVNLYFDWRGRNYYARY